LVSEDPVPLVSDTDNQNLFQITVTGMTSGDTVSLSLPA